MTHILYHAPHPQNLMGSVAVCPHLKKNKNKKHYSIAVFISVSGQLIWGITSGNISHAAWGTTMALECQLFAVSNFGGS